MRPSKQMWTALILTAIILFAAAITPTVTQARYPGQTVPTITKKVTQTRETPDPSNTATIVFIFGQNTETPANTQTAQAQTAAPTRTPTHTRPASTTAAALTETLPAEQPTADQNLPPAISTPTPTPTRQLIESTVGENPWVAPLCCGVALIFFVLFLVLGRKRNKKGDSQPTDS